MAARPPGEHIQPQVVVTIEPEQIPAIQLEQQQITMTVSPPCMRQVINGNAEISKKDAEKIVGQAESLGAEKETKETKSEPKKPVEEKPISRLTVEHAEKRQRRRSTEIIEYIEEQEKHFLSKVQQAQEIEVTSKKFRKRSPSPASQRQSVGLDHLENLVKLIEQLTNLRDENNKLKKRCAFLESTKNLLQTKHTLMSPIRHHHSYHGYMSLPTRGKLQRANTDPDDPRRSPKPARYPSISEAALLDIIESCSDQTPKRPRSDLPRRSFSAGSIKLPDDLYDTDTDEDTASVSKRSPDKIRSKSLKEKSKAKWKSIIRVLKGQKLYDINLGLERLKEFRKGHIRYSVPLPRDIKRHGVEHRLEDSGVGCGFEAEICDALKQEVPFILRPDSTNGDKSLETDPVSGIYMGPPEWLEKHAGNRKSSYSSNQSQASGSDKPIPEILVLRRKESSPVPIQDDFTESSDTGSTIICTNPHWQNDDISSSLKDLDGSVKGDDKFHKVAWKKVKDIMQPIRGSVRHKSVKKCHEQELSDTYLDGILLDGLQSGDTTRTTDYSLSTHSSNSSPIVLKKGDMSSVPLTAGAMDMATILGGLSDEFSRKMNEWEEMKDKRLSVPAGGQYSPRLSEKKDIPCSITPPERASTPVEMVQVKQLEESQAAITESFNRKMKEWEKKKYKRDIDRSPSLERRSSGEKKSRTKSKRVKSEKDKEAARQEKHRERELQKVERETQKLEKEKIRLEKVCLKTLEREARIEKMKGRLSLSDFDTTPKNPVLGPLAECKITTEFAKKLHEWEEIKGQSKEFSTALYLEAKQKGFDLTRREGQSIKKDERVASNGSIVLSDTEELKTQQTLHLHSSESTDDASLVDRTSDSSMAASGTSGKSDVFEFYDPSPPKVKQKPPPLTLRVASDNSIVYMESPEPSPLERSSETSIIDDTTSITNDLPTTSNIASLERANKQIIEELRKKELEYNGLHEAVDELSERLNLIKSLHDDQTDGSDSSESTFLSKVIPDLLDDTDDMGGNMEVMEDKIKELEVFSEKLAMSMESAAMFKWQSIEGQKSVSVRLMELINKMKRMLFKASGSEGQPQMQETLQNFEKLYCQAMQLQLQRNNLRLSHLDRNTEIMFMKRQLILQEVNNLLLQVDITKRQSELLLYTQCRQHVLPSQAVPYAPQRIEEPPDDFTEEEDEDTPVNEKHPLHRMLSRQNTSDISKPCPVVRQLAVDHDEADTHIPIGKKPVVSTPSATAIHAERLNSSSRIADSLSSIPSSKSCDMPHLPSAQPTHTMTTNIPENPALMEKKLKSLKKEVLSSNRDSTTFSDSSQSSDVPYLYTLPLPVKNISIPKDISSSERKLVRHVQQRPIPHSEEDESQSEVSLDDYCDIAFEKDADMEFPELFIPDWQKPPKPKQTKSMDEQIYRQEGASRIKFVDINIEPNGKKKLKREQEERPTPVFYSPMISSRFQRRKPNEEAPDSRPASTYEFFDLQDPEGIRRRMPSTSSISSSEPEVTGSRVTVASLVRPRMYPDEKYQKRKPLHRIIPHRDRHGYASNMWDRLDLCKTPSPTLHLARIGILTPARRLKPAVELWEDSKRYRSGHSVYATRILQMQARTARTSLQNKENVPAGYVKQVVKRLSRENTPDDGDQRQRIDSNVSSGSKCSNEFVQKIVRKLSAPSDSAKPTAPFTDVTNHGKVKELSEAFHTDATVTRTVSDSVLTTTVSIEPNVMVDDVFIDGTRPRPSSHPKVSTTTGSKKPDSTITTQASSLPSLKSKHKKDKKTKSKPPNLKLEKNMDDDIEVLSKDKSSDRPWSPSWRSMFHKKQAKSESKGGNSKKETVGVLCQQSLSFDLGMSPQSDKEEGISPIEGISTIEGAESAAPEPSFNIPSVHSDGESSLPTSPTEKKKHRRFTSPGWLQKPMKLFKVSK